jgi:membrane protein
MTPMAATQNRSKTEWPHLFGPIWRQTRAHDVFGRSAQLAYYFLFSLFPLLIVLIAILGYFTKPGTELRHDLLKLFSAVAPGSASALVNTTLDEISAGAGKGKISLGLAAALWASSSGVAALMKAFNAAFGLKKTRFWLKRRLAAVGITVLFTLLIFAALLLILAGDQILNRISHHFGMQHLISQSWSLLQWPLMLGFVLLAFDFLYCFAPNFPQVVWHWLTPGASVAIAI